MRKSVLFLLLLNSLLATAQIDRVEPPNWWIGFKDTTLQLLVKGKDISGMTPEINYPGVSLTEVHPGTSPNYLFIDLNLKPEAQAGTFEITFKAKGKKKITSRLV